MPQTTASTTKSSAADAVGFAGAEGGVPAAASRPTLFRRIVRTSQSDSGDRGLETAVSVAYSHGDSVAAAAGESTTVSCVKHSVSVARNSTTAGSERARKSEVGGAVTRSQIACQASASVVDGRGDGIPDSGGIATVAPPLC